MKRLEREEYERMIYDEYHVDLIDKILEVFCDYPKKGKQQRLKNDSYKKKYLRLYRDSMDLDMWGSDYRIMFYQEQLDNLESLKTDMIDAEEADYTDDSLGGAIASFVIICLLNWFIFGPLFAGWEPGTTHYGFLTWLLEASELHWFIFLVYLCVNYGITLLTLLMLYATFPIFFSIFKKKLTAEQQKDKAIALVALKIEKLRKEVKNKGYIKKFLNV